MSFHVLRSKRSTKNQRKAKHQVVDPEPLVVYPNPNAEFHRQWEANTVDWAYWKKFNEQEARERKEMDEYWDKHKDEWYEKAYKDLVKADEEFQRQLEETRDYELLSWRRSSGHKHEKGSGRQNQPKGSGRNGSSAV